MSDRPYEIIVYGATGYTGRLVAEYLSNHYGSSDNAPKWAMAGRSLSKLEEVREWFEPFIKRIKAGSI